MAKSHKKHKKNKFIPMPLPFKYEELNGKFTTLPLYHYQLMCFALEVIESRLVDADDPDCIDNDRDPELGEAYHSLSIAVACHTHWKDNLSICNQVHNTVRARYLERLRASKHASFTGGIPYSNQQGRLI